MELTRLISLAKKLEPMVKTNKEEVSAQGVYLNFFDVLYPKQRDFFDKLEKPDLLNLIILIYSIKKTGNVSYSAEIFDKLRFSCYLVTENQNSEEDCYACDGNGNQDCEYCDGNANIHCDECDGNGEVECRDCNGTTSQTCDKCDGEGELSDGSECDNCDGKGGFTCSTCGGSGEEECDECSGEGRVDCGNCDNGWQTCGNCDGSGTEISDTKIDFSTFQVASWSEILNNYSELNVETETPLMSEDEFLAIEEKIIFKKDTHQMEPEIDLRSDVIYCYSFTSEPIIYKSHSRLGLYDNEEFDFYFT